MRARREEIESPDVNLTPLIDVVFVVLIMFMIVAPLLDLEHVTLPPAADTGANLSVMDNSPISITVQSDNTILWQKRQVNLDELRALVAAAHEQHPEARPQLMQDQRSQFGIYQRVKNILEELGFKELDVILKPN
ncbi:MAG: biopolymer transporter ExbD [Chlamydiia bacterium]|nr:biopolymer transporter ExbD [Chlamydiia bacterium]